MAAVIDECAISEETWTAEELERLVAAFTRRRIVAGGAAALAGWAAPSLTRATAATPTTSWSFTDDRGVAVTVPERPLRIAAFIDCAASLWQFGVRPTAVFGQTKTADGKPDLRVGDVDIAAVTVIGDNGGSGLDIEALVNARPDVIVSNMWAKDVLNNIDPGQGGSAQIAKVAPAIGVSMLNRTVTEVLDRYKQLAVALGATTDEPSTVAAEKSYQDACERVRQAAKANPELTFIFGFGTADQLWIADPTQWPDLSLLTSLGVNIVIPHEEAHGDGNPFYSVSWERLGLYPADVFMSQVPGTPDGGGDIWKQYPAVAAGQVGSWGPDPFWLLYTYKNYTRILTDFAATIASSKVVS